MLRFDDKVIVITGASKGIGKACAEVFAKQGASLVLAARNTGDLEALAQSLNTPCEIFACNTRSIKQLEALADFALSAFGKIDVLVNNAGGAMPNDALAISPEQFNDDYHFNVTSPMHLSQLLAPSLAEQKGAIVNITSQAGKYAQAGFSSYGTAKAALNHLSKQLAQDFAPNIRVNAVSPGTIYTQSLAGFLDDTASQKMVELTPMKALGKAEDIAHAVLFLASQEASWITGKVLEVDGGAESSTWPF